MLIKQQIICKFYYKFILTDAIENENIFLKKSCNTNTKNRHIFNSIN